MSGPEYVGRFAPSPSGPLHMGSLVAALASYLDARAHRGTWLVRIEDIDPPREAPGAAQAIIQSLRHHGLHWDGDVIWQRQHTSAFDKALQQLRQQGDLFSCSCSRRQLSAQGGRHQLPCIAAPIPGNAAQRLRVDDREIQFVDRLQGCYRENLRHSSGDPILRRRDGLYAYHLAVVVDDMNSSVTDVVRGIDLLSATPTHIFLQQKLAAPPPRYMHIPVLANRAGEKLSKQRGATAVADTQAPSNLRRCLSYLGQMAPPDTLQDPASLLAWGCQHWRPEAIPTCSEIVIS